MSKLYNVAGGALLHEELNDNYWKDKAKKLIKDGESVPDHWDYVYRVLNLF